MSTWPPYITEEVLDAIIAQALLEDVGSGDITTEATVPREVPAMARMVSREAGVLAGTVVAEKAFRYLHPDVHVTWEYRDGQLVPPGATVAIIEGPARAILTSERVALNFLQRMSGIATLTRRMVEAIRPYRARLLDTRKTVPGLRVLDKWAVRIGGGENHRMGLYDMVLIKENHIRAAGGLRQALDAVRDYLEQKNLKVPIEIEARTIREVVEILRWGKVDRILLDNMVDLLPDGRVDVHRLEEAVEIVDGETETEASGNVTLETVHFIAATGVDYISSGLLTHSARALDLSLLFEMKSA